MRDQRLYLKDILAAAESIEAFVAGMDFETFQADDKTVSVGALRGVVNNVSSALGAAFSSVVAVGLLSFFIISAFNLSNLPPILRYEINFDKIDFVSNDQLKTVLSQTSATPAEVNVAVLINALARLRALKATFLIVAAISLLSIFPSLRLPGYTPGELSVEELTKDHPPGSVLT